MPKGELIFSNAVVGPVLQCIELTTNRVQTVVSGVQSFGSLQENLRITKVSGVHQGLRRVQLDINLPLGHVGGAHVRLCSLLLLSRELVGEGQLSHRIHVLGGQRFEGFQR